MLSSRLQSFLENHNVAYNTIKHPPAYTAPEIAALAHISGKELAKVVMVKIDGKLAMIIEPSSLKVNMQALAKWFKGQRVELATESEFKDWFPECEPGAMPPIGALYDMDVFEEDCFEDMMGEQGKIAFNAGTHTDLVQMDYNTFEKLAKPKKIHLERERSKKWHE